MTTGEKIRTRRKQLGMKVDELAAKVGKDRATIYRYENDEIKMPASLLQPLADALGMTPNELMDWGELPTDGAEHQNKMREVLSLISDGVSVEGGTLKYVLFKAFAYGGDMESGLYAALLTLYQLNQGRQDTKIHTLRILGELVASLDPKYQKQLVSYAEFLDFQRQKQLGQHEA